MEPPRSPSWAILKAKQKKAASTTISSSSGLVVSSFTEAVDLLYGKEESAAACQKENNAAKPQRHPVLHATNKENHHNASIPTSNVRIFTSKLLNRLWEDSEEHKPCAENYDCLFVWPPRLYSCNFCDREFRSAQALGGHMNIHRRERARLRQELHPDPNEDCTTVHAPTFERSNTKAVCGFKRAYISPRVYTLSPNPTVIRENQVGFLIKDQMKDNPTISSKRRCVNPLIESQDEEVLDLELRL